MRRRNIRMQCEACLYIAFLQPGGLNPHTVDSNYLVGFSSRGFWCRVCLNLTKNLFSVTVRLNSAICMW